MSKSRPSHHTTLQGGGEAEIKTQVYVFLAKTFAHQFICSSKIILLASSLNNLIQGKER